MLFWPCAVTSILRGCHPFCHETQFESFISSEVTQVLGFVVWITMDEASTVWKSQHWFWDDADSGKLHLNLNLNCIEFHPRHLTHPRQRFNCLSALLAILSAVCKQILWIDSVLSSRGQCHDEQWLDNKMNPHGCQRLYRPPNFPHEILGFQNL